MNRIVVIWFFITTFLVGCSSINGTEPIPVHPLFSTDHNKYSLLVVSETNMSDYHKWLEENEIYNVEKIHGRSSLEETNDAFKFLELEKSPAYVVFDTKDIEYKTYSKEELIKFLKENNPTQLKEDES
ncbi:hypothetical protein [Metabacillus litoralis]|uniref:hypothetical protein n=1 Tax=Metabacillus litoralis TaxID=152268 RepID=UPI001CFECEF7|nr:hypothetical protein [Metabacillus litoralis]